MASIELNLEKSVALVSSETASPAIRIIGALSAASILLNQHGASIDGDYAPTIVALIDHLSDQAP